MKNKRLIIILAVLSLCTVVVVLTSTLFTMKSVSLHWLTETYMFKNIDASTIIDSATMPYNESIFMVNKNKIIDELEKENPYLKVVSIETKFPNKLVVHIAERSEFFAIKLSDSEYAIVDGECKVLKMVTEAYFSNDVSAANPIKVTVDNFNLSKDAFVVGEVLRSNRIVDIIQNVAYSLRETDHDATTSKGIFDSVTIEVKGERADAVIKTKWGLYINITDVDSSTTDKLLLGIALYNDKKEDHVFYGTILVFENTGEILATYLEQN